MRLVRNFWQEGYDDFLDGLVDDPPQDVIDSGQNAIDDWLDGWASAQEDDDDDYNPRNGYAPGPFGLY